MLPGSLLTLSTSCPDLTPDLPIPGALSSDFKRKEDPESNPN